MPDKVQQTRLLNAGFTLQPEPRDGCYWLCACPGGCDCKTQGILGATCRHLIEAEKPQALGKLSKEK